MGPPHRLRLGGGDAGRRAAPARRGGRSARPAFSLRQSCALDHGRDGKTAAEARRRVVASLGNALWNASSLPRPARFGRAGRRAPGGGCGGGAPQPDVLGDSSPPGPKAAILGLARIVAGAEGLVALGPATSSLTETRPRPRRCPPRPPRGRVSFVSRPTASTGPSRARSFRTDLPRVRPGSLPSGEPRAISRSPGRPSQRCRAARETSRPSFSRASRR